MTSPPANEPPKVVSLLRIACIPFSVYALHTATACCCPTPQSYLLIFIYLLFFSFSLCQHLFFIPVAFHHFLEHKITVKSWTKPTITILYEIIQKPCEFIKYVYKCLIYLHILTLSLCLCGNTVNTKLYSVTLGKVANTIS